MKLNKILSLILAFVFVFTTAVACFPALIVNASTIELAEGDYENAYQVLKSICPEFPLSDKEKTTREEFVAAVAMVLNVPDNVSFRSEFTDVQDSPYVNEIAYALDMGIISNVSLFYPDIEVTYAQAIKIVMSAAGYGKKAELSGGFPIGYLKCANEAGVGKGIALSDSDFVSHEMAIELIFEACCTDMLEVTSYGSSYNYTITEGKNIFYTYHGIYMAEGVVEANKHTGLEMPSQATTEGYITVDGTTYKGVDYDHLIGKRVRVLFKDDKSRNIIHAYEIDNNITTYTGNDDLVISGTTLTSCPEASTKEIRHSLETDFEVIYNGKAYFLADYNSVINPSSGTVSLIDNDGNKRIDVIIIKSVQYGIIGNVNALEGKIYDKYKKNAMIDLHSADIKYTITDTEGTVLALDSLEPGDAIGYIISNDKTTVEIIRQLKRVGGTYKSLSSNNKIEVKGTEYLLSDYYVENVKSADELKFDTEIVLYLSSDDQVIYIQEYAASLEYGFLVAVRQQSGLDNDVAVKIFTSGGQMLEAQVADKPVLDGIVKTSKNEVKAYLDETVEKQYAYRVVKYSLNADGEVKKIYTATDNTDGTSVLYELTSDEFRPIIYYDCTEVVDGIIPETGDINYSVAKSSCPMPQRGAFTYFHVDSFTKIMRIPARPAQFSDDDNFKIIDTAPSNEYLRIAAYDVSYGGLASFVIIPSDTAAGNIDKGYGSAIIDSITDGITEDGEVVKIIKAYYAGKWDRYYYHPEKTVITKDLQGGNASEAETELTINDFAPGDIIRISPDSKNFISEMRMNFDVSEKKVVSEMDRTDTNNGRYVEYISGYALGYDRNRLILATDNTMEEIEATGGSVNVSKTYSGTFTRGTTLFVKFHRKRNSDEITRAEIYLEENADNIETYFNSGKNADYVVLRQYFRDPSLNVVYVNIDE